MRALQGEGSTRLVIERRWFPFGVVMTLGALRRASLRKLAAVDVPVTLFALGRRRREIHLADRGNCRFRFVTIDTDRGLVRTQQRERRF